MAGWSDLILGESVPAAQPGQAQGGSRWSDQLLGGSGPDAAPMPAKAANPNAEPDAPTWFGRRMQDIRGKRDPRFKDLPEFVDTEGAGNVSNALLAGKVVAGDDKVYGDIVASSLGDRLIKRETDANGYEVVTYRGDNGEPISAYVNKPGLNLEDVNRGAFGALPYVAGAGVAGKALQKMGAGIVTRILGQTVAAPTVSVTNDLLAGSLGSEQGVSGERALVAAAAGGLGQAGTEVGTALWRRFVTEPSLYNRATGELTDKGIELAKRAGVDPDAIRGNVAREFARTYAKTGSETQAAIRAPMSADGVPVSRGQLTKDKEQLLREEGMRRGLYGDDAKNVMLGFDQRQRTALQEAATGTGPRTPSSSRGPAPPLSVRDEIAPNATAAPTRQDLGQSIFDDVSGAMGTAKAGERKAWETARSLGPLEPTPQALAKLPEVFERKGVADVVDVGLGELPSTTPTALRMVRELEEYAAGGAPKTAASPLLKPNARTDVDSIRQRLFATMKGTTDPRDRQAAGAVYDAYNEWLDEAANQVLLQGDQLAAAALKNARDATRNLKQIFEPRDGGKLAPEAKVISKIAEAGDSPERIIENLFGGKGVTQEGKVAALRQLKRAYQAYLDPADAKAAVDNMKLAYWTKLVRDRRGEIGSDIASPQLMLNELNNAFANQRSIMRELFSPAEVARINQFRGTLKAVTYRDPNPSGTSYGVASFAKEAISAFLNGLGLNSVPVQMLVRYSGVSNIYGSVQARRAVNQAIKPKAPNALLAPSLEGATVPGSTDER